LIDKEMTIDLSYANNRHPSTRTKSFSGCFNYAVEMISKTISRLRVGQVLEIKFPTFILRITIRSENELTVEIPDGRPQRIFIVSKNRKQASGRSGIRRMEQSGELDQRCVA
jgi:hypothetical protein